MHTIEQSLNNMQIFSMIVEPRHEQICLRSFLLSLTQSELSTKEDGQKL